MDFQFTIKKGKEQLEKEIKEKFAVMFKHGSMRLEYYAPVEKDHQKPHNQDEIYVIACGSGTFTRGDENVFCKQGDVLFVNAGVEHKFENFTDDFATWVIFYGPEGGE